MGYIEYTAEYWEELEKIKLEQNNALNDKNLTAKEQTVNYYKLQLKQYDLHISYLKNYVLRIDIPEHFKDREGINSMLRWVEKAKTYKWDEIHTLNRTLHS